MRRLIKKLLFLVHQRKTDSSSNEQIHDEALHLRETERDSQSINMKNKGSSPQVKIKKRTAQIQTKSRNYSERKHKSHNKVKFHLTNYQRQQTSKLVKVIIKLMAHSHIIKRAPITCVKEEVHTIVLTHHGKSVNDLHQGAVSHV